LWLECAIAAAFSTVAATKSGITRSVVSSDEPANVGESTVVGVFAAVTAVFTAATAASAAAAARCITLLLRLSTAFAIDVEE
jgi:hypothetical protein